MLIQQTHFPMGNNNGSNWGTIILVTVLFIGVGVVAYRAMKPEIVMPSVKKKENETQ